MKLCIIIFLHVALVAAIQRCQDGVDCPSLELMNSAAPGESFIIAPDTNLDTACIFSSAGIVGGFTFQVFPGSSEKFVIVFRGGAPLTYSQAIGSTFLSATNDVTESETVSVLPFDIPDNAGGVYSRDGFSGNTYTDYTIVSISQCTGDLHLGVGTKFITVDASTSPPTVLPVDFKGKSNADAAIAWINANKASTGIKDLVIHGTSSGAIAALTFARDIFGLLQPSGIKRVVTDGNPTLATSGTDSIDCQSFLTNTQALQTIGACDVLSSTTLITACNNGEPIASLDVVNAAIEENDDDVLFLEIAAKKDGNIITNLSLLGFLALGDLDFSNPIDPTSFTGQYISYCGTGFMGGVNPLFLSELEYYKALSTVVNQLSSKNENYKAFFVDTNGHEMMDAEVQIIELGAEIAAGTSFPGFADPLPVNIWQGALDPSLTSDFVPKPVWRWFRVIRFTAAFPQIETCGLDGCFSVFLDLYEWLGRTIEEYDGRFASLYFLSNECFGKPTSEVTSLDECSGDFLSKKIFLEPYFP